MKLSSKTSAETANANLKRWTAWLFASMCFVLAVSTAVIEISSGSLGGGMTISDLIAAAPAIFIIISSTVMAVAAIIVTGGATGKWKKSKE